MGEIDRCRHSHDIEIRRPQIARGGGECNAGRDDILGRDLAGPVGAVAQLGDALGVDVKADHLEAGAAERRGDRQTHIAEADDCNGAQGGHAGARRGYLENRPASRERARLQ